MAYDDVILADEPELFWELDQAASSTTCTDSSGNGHSGKFFASQAQSASKVSSNWTSGVRNGNKCVFIAGDWSGAPLTQQAPGAGIRADDYKPYRPGCKITFEMWVNKTEEESFATMFSGKGAGSGSPGSTNSPEFTWEMGADGMMRFYPNVETYPVGWVDWGNMNTGHPDTDFILNKWQHIVCQWNDQRRVAEWWVQGRSMGKQKLTGYAGVDLRANRVRDAGLFQVGWRGNYTTPNTEVLQGFVDNVAVYERILTPKEINRHYRAGKKTGE